MNSLFVIAILLAGHLGLAQETLVDTSKDEVLSMLPTSLECDAFWNSPSARSFGKVTLRIEKTEEPLVEVSSTSEPNLNFKIGREFYPYKRRQIFADQWQCEYYFTKRNGYWGFIYACNVGDQLSPTQTNVPTTHFMYSDQLKAGQISNGDKIVRTWALRNCR